MEIEEEKIRSFCFCVYGISIILYKSINIS